MKNQNPNPNQEQDLSIAQAKKLEMQHFLNKGKRDDKLANAIFQAGGSPSLGVIVLDKLPKSVAKVVRVFKRPSRH